MINWLAAGLFALVAFPASGFVVAGKVAHFSRSFRQTKPGRAIRQAAASIPARSCCPVVAIHFIPDSNDF